MAACLTQPDGYTSSTTTVAPIPHHSNTPGGVIKCRKCRQELCEVADIIPHKEGMGQVAFSWNKRSLETKVSNSLQTEDFVSINNASLSPITTNAYSSPIFEQLQKLNLEFDEEAGGYVFKDDYLLNQSNQTPDSVATILPKDNSLFASLNPNCKSFFIQHKEWMDKSVLGSNQGKLNCPKCIGRLGSFNWAGTQCSCGQWVTPAFQVHKARIDLLTSDF